MSTAPPERASGFTRLVRFCFSFPVFLACALMALAALTVRDRFDDPDLWWHLKVGQVIWTTHSIPTTDLFSHTAFGHPWIPHEWLAQWTIYAAYRLGGYSGLMLWLLLWASLLLVLLYALSCLYSGNAKVSLVGGMIGWYFATVGLAIRPALMGYVLLVVELLILQLGRTRDRRWFWGLPLLFAVWVNCHGSYSFGLLILAVVAGCAFWEWRWGPMVSRAWPAAVRKMLIWASAASVAALFLNPLGWRLLTYPFNTLFLQHTGLAIVQEWLPLPFADSRTPGLLLILAGAALAAAAGKAEIRVEEMVLVGIAAVMAVLHQRMLFLFGIMAAPVVCRLLAGAWENYDAQRDWRAGNAVAMGIAALVVFFSFPGQGALAAQVAKANPVEAVEFVRKAGLRGPMLNDYTLGGYLIWALPEHKVFVDGRSDVYDWTGVLLAFEKWALLEEDPQILLNRYRIRFCILSSGSPLTRVLPYLPGWRKAFGDALASVFVRENAPVVAPNVR